MSEKTDEIKVLLKISARGSAMQDMTFFMILDEKLSKRTPLVEAKVLVEVIISVTVHGSRNTELGLGLGIPSIIEALSGDLEIFLARFGPMLINKLNFVAISKGSLITLPPVTTSETVQFLFMKTLS